MAGRPRINPTPEQVALLGTVADRVIAEQAGVCLALVYHWRTERGIAAAGKQGRTKKAPPVEVEALLGTMTDRDLAERAGVCIMTARSWRTARGVPPYRKHLQGSDPADRIEQKHPGITSVLGIASDVQIAKHYGLSRERVRQYRTLLDLPSYQSEQRKMVEEVLNPLLGTMTDVAVAEETGVCVAKINKFRREQQTPAFESAHEKGQREVLESIRHRLGVETDGKLTRITCLPRGVVARYRNSLGIPPAYISPRSKDFVRLDYDAVRRMVGEGKTNGEIAEVLGTSPQYICTICSKLGIKRTKQQRYHAWYIARWGKPPPDSVEGT